MGIGGHMLGERKLRRLNRETGMEFDRAYNRNGHGVARTSADDHYEVDYTAWPWSVTRIEDPNHWYSCHHPNA